MPEGVGNPCAPPMHLAGRVNPSAEAAVSRYMGPRASREHADTGATARERRGPDVQERKG